MSTTNIVFYHRNLPHFHPKGGIFFITLRLADSIPIHIVRELKQEREIKIGMMEKTFKGNTLKTEKTILEKHLFAKFDEWLDACNRGPQWLKNERIARTVSEKIQELDGRRYRLIAYSIMPNHVHLLMNLDDYDKTDEGNLKGTTKNYPLTDSLRLLKGSTARFCNIILERSGAFWHHESYDHCVRDETENYRIIEYILNNPVKAGLVANWKDWKYNYCISPFEPQATT